ncbi:MAG TPA: hypothetical protein VHV74_26685 [Pseudonocardiaceae bacterium]|jgi:hypothetical protein|nr:hypothetical protein [Pseudonocardiaceae bacterium]
MPRAAGSQRISRPRVQPAQQRGEHCVGAATACRGAFDELRHQHGLSVVDGHRLGRGAPFGGKAAASQCPQHGRVAVDLDDRPGGGEQPGDPGWAVGAVDPEHPDVEFRDAGDPDVVSVAQVVR